MERPKKLRVGNIYSNYTYVKLMPKVNTGFFHWFVHGLFIEQNGRVILFMDRIEVLSQTIRVKTKFSWFNKGFFFSGHFIKYNSFHGSTKG